MHYLDLSLRDSATTQDIQTALLAAVHALNFNTAENARMAIAFPEWQESQFSGGRHIVDGSTGSVFRVFGAPAQLEKLVQTSRVQLALTCSLLTASGVQPVPAATEWVRFVRERGKDRRTSPSALRRLQRRAEARGEVRDLSPLPRMPSEKPFQGISCQSSSTGQPFELRVAKDTETSVFGWASSFSTYGLATGTGGVPSF